MSTSGRKQRTQASRSLASTAIAYRMASCWMAEMRLDALDALGELRVGEFEAWTRSYLFRHSCAFIA